PCRHHANGTMDARIKSRACQRICSPAHRASGRIDALPAPQQDGAIVVWSRPDRSPCMSALDSPAAARVDPDLCYTPATELARLVAARKLSPVERTRTTLARIDAVKPVLNCFCFVYPEEALEKAERAEAAVMRGDALGPLHGVPVAIKDMTPTRGKRTTLGSRAYEHNVPDHDAPIVE